MNPAIDFRTLPQNVPIICIPRVFSNINEPRIRRVFDELNLGIIERIDLVSKTTEKGEKFNRVFVHFKKWNSGGNAEIARERLLNGKDIKIVYDDPWFWKVSAYRQPAKETRQKAHSTPKPQKKATIVFETDEDQRPSVFVPRQIPKKSKKSDMENKAVAEPRKIETRKIETRKIETRKIEPRSPSSSPPPRSPEFQEDSPPPPPLPLLDYGTIVTPKKRAPRKPTVLKIEQTDQDEQKDKDEQTTNDL
jgi:hypothetical protein